MSHHPLRLSLVVVFVISHKLPQLIRKKEKKPSLLCVLIGVYVYACSISLSLFLCVDNFHYTHL